MRIANPIPNIELIDTCWDVNIAVLIANYVTNIRINRYMLGCKYHPVLFCFAELAELIDTCWDVNSLTAFFNSFMLLELIDTCWDVNFYIK